MYRYYRLQYDLLHVVCGIENKGLQKKNIYFPNDFRLCNPLADYSIDEMLNGKKKNLFNIPI